MSMQKLVNLLRKTSLYRQEKKVLMQTAKAEIHGHNNSEREHV